jgi:hypothetical protein
MLKGKAQDQAVQDLLDFMLEYDDAGKVVGRSGRRWADYQAHHPDGPKYSRAWLLVERALMQALEPQAMIDVDAEIAAAKAAWNGLPAKVKEANPFDSKAIQNVIIRRCRLEDGDSWGRISVRMNIPENRVRSLFRNGGALRDKGLRIGKGGRWLMDDQDLYQAHRIKEGAAIDVSTPLSTVKHNPAALVNADHRLAEVRSIPALVNGNTIAAEFAKARDQRNAAAKATRAERTGSKPVAAKKTVSA